MSQRFKDPKLIVTYQWRKRPARKWKYVEYMYEDLSQYYERRRDADDSYEEVIVNTRQVTGRVASQIAEMNENYHDSMPMELFTST